MQQHLMQMQPMMASYYSNNNITTDHIQQYLDENKALILKIVESQNSGKINECAENQAKLQRNLMYLASIADSQPQPPTMQSQYPISSTMLPIEAHFTQHQQQQPQTMTPQELMAASSSMLYSQQPYAALQPQVGMGSGGFHILQGEPGTSAIGFSDHFGLATTSKEDAGTSAAGDGSENLHLKSLHDGR